VNGDLTVSRHTVLGDTPTDRFILTSSGLNVAQNGTINDTDSSVRMYDDVLITGELSVSSDLEVHGSGVSRFTQGRIVLGVDTASDLSDDAGDFYGIGDGEIQDDLSIGGDLTIGNVLSVAGSILPTYLPGTKADIFYIDYNESTTRPTLSFVDSEGNENFRWNDVFSTLEMADDLSIGGALTVEKELIIEGSVTDLHRFENGRLYVGSDAPSVI
ncbi:MAG: hypothetical protein GY706_10150, partial [Bacteroides sp.]|nr:hypothetical protein [Bacteroides sp.]